jgi:hypothetical protein
MVFIGFLIFCESSSMVSSVSSAMIILLNSG